MLINLNKLKFSKSFSGKKWQKDSRFKPNSSKAYFANFNVIASEPGFLTSFQIETVRRFLRKALKKKALFVIKAGVTTPITKKPKDVRLGRGKGDMKCFAAAIKKGTIIFEIYTNNIAFVSLILPQIFSKLPFKSFIFCKHKR